MAQNQSERVTAAYNLNSSTWPQQDNFSAASHFAESWRQRGKPAMLANLGDVGMGQEGSAIRIIK